MAKLTEDLAARHRAKIVDSSDDAIVSKDLNGTILSWNSAAERMFGYTAAEAIGQSVRMIIPPDRQSEEDFVLSQVRRGEAVCHYETIRQRKDGTTVPISLTVSPIYDDAGAVIGASKIARDISEQVTLRAVAHDQAVITQKLSEVGAVLAASLDPRAIVQKVTDVGTGFTEAEFGAFFDNAVDRQAGESYELSTVSGAPKGAMANLPQRRFPTLFAETCHGAAVVRLDDVTQDPRCRSNQPFAGRAPGHVAIRSYLAVPVKAASGEVLGGLLFGHSRVGVFTAQHEQLAIGIAAWASVALENAHLYLEAREADRLKDEFLAVLSHELRTPLNAIVGYARLLRGGMLGGEKASRALETLERNATSLTQIVEDILDISRIVSGKLRLDVQTVELPIVVHNAVATVQPAADAKGVRLNTIVDPRVGPVSGDPDRLQQVVWNLLSNAVKFTPRGGRVQVRVQRVDSHIEIGVSDTGAGIRADFLPHVFERFRQGDSGITRKTGGLGLGLSIVRHIVEMHGGSVHVASDGEGQGATFSVQLPLMIVHPEGKRDLREHPATANRAALTRLASLEGVRVLAVDDDQDALGLLRVVLQTAGAHVTTVSSPAEALTRIASARPQVLVVDLGMPEIDGFEFITRVRESPDADVRDIPAAALTAFARSEDRTRALQSGFEMHLAKPVDPGELVASVATLVRRAKGR